MSARDTAIGALESVVAAALAPVEVTRDETRTRNPPASGLVLLREGETRDATAVMSPLSYIVEHEAELLAVVPQATTVAAARADLDALVAAIAAAVEADRTLGGAADFALIGVPRFEADEGDGDGALLAALIPVALTFTAPGSPAG